MTYSKCIFPSACLLFYAASAQSPSHFLAHARAASSIHGSVVRECVNSQDKSFDNLRVEVISRQNGNRSYAGDVAWDGGFEIRDVAEGVYEVQVVNLQSTVIKRTILTVNSMGNQQEMHISIPCAEKQTTGGISIRRLSHKPAKKAANALKKAGEAQRKGNVTEWEKNLRLAVKLDPDYFEARNNLGAFLARHNRPAEALEEFRAALEIDPDAAPILTNISASLLSLNQTKEAEAYARRALAIDPLSMQAHYLIGVALVKQNQFTLEAADHLHDSGTKFPKALEVEAAVRDRIRRQTGE